MGFDLNSVKYLLDAKTLGVDFSETATIGRQSLCLSQRQLEGILKAARGQYSKPEINACLEGSGGYSESFLHMLGAKRVDSFDCSSYEGASYEHDMNKPLDKRHFSQYSLVIDGGSLEHIFNFTTAVKNCMEMVRIGGHFISIVPANNWLGHGFYQFSPELYFRIFSSENGYKVCRMVVFEENSDDQWFDVIDPLQVHERVTLCNRKRTYLAVLAEKTDQKDVFSSSPQQSDYVEAWNESAPVVTEEKGLKVFLKSILPDGLKKKLRRLFFSPYHEKHYKKIKWPL